MKNVFIVVLMLLTGAVQFISCGEAEDIITPSHYSRVPRAINLTASYDTSATGNYIVSINWSVESSNNLKDFEIYRSVNSSNFFFLSGGIAGSNFIDSSYSNTTDSLDLAYYVNGRGLDRFVGQSSEIVRIIVKKSF
jgi:hypothetical protein